MTQLKTYRKKPVEIQAMKFEYTSLGIEALINFGGDFIGRFEKARTPTAKGEVEIKTLEDGNHLRVTHIATEGDFIIRGIRGELYACKPDIFEATYEEVAE